MKYEKELDDLLANELPAKDLDYVSPQNSYTHCRIAWTIRHTGVKSFGNWQPISNENNLIEWVNNLNTQHPSIKHWVERTTF